VVLELLNAGLYALKDYVGAHVLTCLVPAFLLAGAIVTFVDREAVVRYLGESARKVRSFSLASGSSFFLAACSCTVIPVASGLYYGGAAVGVAFIVLWVAPAANILALVYTGNVIGPEMVLARIVAAVLMAFVVGGVMTLAFGRERGNDPSASAVSPAAPTRVISGRAVALIVLIVLSLLLPNYLVLEGPYLHKIAVWALCTLAVALFAWRSIPRRQIGDWLRESWWFVKIIFPLLLAGVFVVGIIGKVLPEEWIRHYLGGNGLRASFLATLLGSVTYFATMTEAPFVDTLMKLGMGKGPALALLLTGPGLSLPNWLAIARVFGVKKALVYVPTLVVLGTLVGWLFGTLVFY
jgi:uncharacterized membrane protein YraQ (UPF0718 family)